MQSQRLMWSSLTAYLRICRLDQPGDALLTGSTEDRPAILQPQEYQTICADVLAGALQLHEDCPGSVLPRDEALPIEHWHQLCSGMRCCLSKCCRVISAGMMRTNLLVCTRVGIL